MSTNRDLLKEAIADAKAVKEMAITNAKLALEEAFTPHLKSMLSTKLQEMEEVEEEMEEKSMYTEEDTEMVKEEEEVEMEAEETESVMDEESMDLEDMSEEDLKSFIEDVISDMVESGELEAGENMEDEDIEDEDMEDMEDMKDGEMETEEEMEEEEVSIDELLAEIDSMYEEEPIEEEEEMVGEGFMDSLKNFTSYFSASKGRVEDLVKEIPMKVFAGKRLASSGKIESFTPPTEADISAIVKAAEEDRGAGRIEIGGGTLVYTPGSELTGPAMASTYENQQEELDEAYSTIKTLRSELNEINLLNAKLLYTNKIFKGKNLTESQKVEVLENFDKTTTVKEVKLVYETLLGAIKTNKNRISENLGSASKSTGTTKKPIIEANDAFSRMREIAFYSTKH
tara:strand:- start:1139 stop:2335 length:1197 start_codon:yes stop_codon:yes gene_type:complete